MPTKAPRLCVCGNIVASGAMCICRQASRAEADRRRPNANARGYTQRWREESKAFLALPANRYCACGCGRLANMVDHIKPHRGNRELFWDRTNWQPMASSPCHSSRKQSLERQSTRKQS